MFLLQLVLFTNSVLYHRGNTFILYHRGNIIALIPTKRVFGADASPGPSYILSVEVLDRVMTIYQCNWRVVDALLVIKTVKFVENSCNSMFYFRYLLLTVFSKHICEFFLKFSSIIIF